jgi:hypothetical protein
MLNSCESRQRELVLNRRAVEQRARDRLARIETVRHERQNSSRADRAGYLYRNGDEHFLTDKGRDALASSPQRPAHAISGRRSPSPADRPLNPTSSLRSVMAGHQEPAL